MPSDKTCRCHFDRGPDGVRGGAERGDILVIVDVLSFSTAVATAIENGGKVYPCSMEDDPCEMAKRIGGEAAVRRNDVPDGGRFSLSPLTYLNIEAGTRIVLSSPNGATCSQCWQTVPYLFTGSLVNAEVVGKAVSNILKTGNLNVTVIACGERTMALSGVERIRWAVEDYLGAGAVLSYISHSKSVEAQVCEAGFTDSQKEIREILLECESGRELRAGGFEEDVEYSAQLNVCNAVPVMRDGHFKAANQ